MQVYSTLYRLASNDKDMVYDIFVRSNNALVGRYRTVQKAVAVIRSLEYDAAHPS